MATRAQSGDTGSTAADTVTLAACYTLEHFSRQLPDLSSVTVITPNDTVARQFELSLCHALDAQAAIIPPWCGTLQRWCLSHTAPPVPDTKLVNEYARQCLFVDALQQNRHLYKEENQWQITQSLLKLFDELNLSPTGLFDDADQWQQNITTAYGIDADASSRDGLLEHLNVESKLVYTLWHAWNNQLLENDCHDAIGNYASRLVSVIDKLSQNPDTAHGTSGDTGGDTGEFIYIGDPPATRLERELISRLQAAGRCTVFRSSICTDGSHVPDNFFCAALMPDSDTSTDEPAGLKQRAIRFRDTLPEPEPVAESEHDKQREHGPLSVYLAQDAEDEVTTVDLFVRQQIVLGKSNIAIICEDRKLSRRLRAVLEHNHVELSDQAGWSLATTQAVSVIERWLQCIEEDFHAYPLLAVLKSPFIDLAPLLGSDQSAGHDDRDLLLKNIYRLENDIILHENVSSNIEQYRKAMRDRLKRLSHWPQDTYRELDQLLQSLQDIASPLSQIANMQAVSLDRFIQALQDSLQKLGVLQLYLGDDAGTVILDTLNQLHAGLEQARQQDATPELRWNDCRSWLSMALEAQHFSPPTSSQPLVRLMTLEQADYQQYDCLVIAACEQQHFPGSPEPVPVFNQSVRASLGLGTWEQSYQIRLRQFIRALSSTDTSLITVCNMDKGEEKPVSPWLDLLLKFHQQVFGRSAVNTGLKKLADALHRISSNRDGLETDDQQRPATPGQPAARLPESLLPKKMSASAYQRLINCPYQFFAADGLGLRAREDISLELSKSDYGQRIHRILQLFHTGDKAPCEAFADTITTGNRERAIEHLTTISTIIFRREMDDNPLHRSWFYRWRKMIPGYIDWQMTQQQEWTVLDGEQQREAELPYISAVTVTGQLDRIDVDRSGDGHMIIDYKTGACPSQKDVDCGEDVQLATYAMLDDRTMAVEYLSIDASDQRVKVTSSLQGDELASNRDSNRDRLIEMMDMVSKASALTAWGDDSVCQHCDFSGICRKQHWPKENHNSKP